MLASSKTELADPASMERRLSGFAGGGGRAEDRSHFQGNSLRLAVW